MRLEPNGPRGRPDEVLAPHTADDALLRWDELDEQLLRMLAEDPERGWRLRKLQDADGWLRSRATEAARKAVGPALLVCPPPEDLYDFGQGPGAASLSAERRASIDRHLATCLECERFVRTLESVPPSPLIRGLPVEVDEPEVMRPRVPQRRPLRLVPVLAATAAAVLLFFGVRALVTPTTMRFPEAPLLRGSAGGPVYFPRDKVLLPSADVAKLFPALATPVMFEVEAQAEADSYRYELSRHEGQALGHDVPLGEPVITKSNTALARIPKEAGRFTFDAWVVRRGLDQRLGARDFQVIADPSLDASLRALADRPEVERTLAAVHALHSAGYWTDARAVARSLPQGRERDLYLDQLPGR